MTQAPVTSGALPLPVRHQGPYHGFLIHHQEEVSSTMAVARALAGSSRRAELSAGNQIAVVLADRQTAGRGRAGHQWQSLAGNLFTTLIWPAASIPLAQRAEVSFVLALALRSAMIALGVAPGAISLNWPNDVLLDGGKVAGLLLEGDGDRLLIGIGVNLATAPQALDQSATSLAAVLDTGAPAPLAALREVLSAFDAEMARWQQEGFRSVQQRWLASAHRLGCDIRARFGAPTAPQQLIGRFEGIDEAGRLILRTTDGQCHLISAASVHQV